MSINKNVFGEPLVICSKDPLTGFFRTGCCETDEQDRGSHTVCAIMTEEFLSFSRKMGNDLITPRPQFEFAGLRPGDRWCLCANRWMEAYSQGIAPLLVLEATHEKTLEFLPLEELVKFAFTTHTGG